MTIAKIIAIKNVGCLKNSAAGGNTTFSKHTFIYGANGFGKTTICAILRSLKSGDGAYVVGRKTLGATTDPTVEILGAGINYRFANGSWTGLNSNLAIYDGIFVAENVHSGDFVDTDQRRNLYRVIVGDAGVALANEETRLATEARAKTGEITAALRTVQSHAPPGMRVEAFMALAPIANIDGEIATQEGRLTTIREAAAIGARAALSPISLPSISQSLSELLATTIDGISQDAEQRVTAHLAAHGMADGAGWLLRGLDHTDLTCPFCSQGVEGSPLIAAYRAVFSERYRQLRSDIEAMHNSITQAFGENAVARLATAAAQHDGALEYWARHCALDLPQLAFPRSVSGAMSSLHTAALALLTRKAAAPLDALGADEALLQAITAYQDEMAKVATFNLAVTQANTLINAKKAEAGSSDVATAQTELNRLKATKIRHSSVVVQLCDSHANLTTEKTALEADKALVRLQLDTHTQNVVRPYEARINDLLDDFNAGFRIAETRHSYAGGVATSSYRLVINDTAIDLGGGETPRQTPSFKNTLSAGDRSVLSLAFFLAHLERDPRLTDKVAVFDDPFNSQDAFRRRQTIHEILKIGRRCAQVIVLSHDATFLKQIWEKCEPAERASLALDDRGDDGSKIVEVDLLTACRGRTANDTDALQAYCTTGAGEHIDLVRKMRTVLETYMRVTYAANFDGDDNLGEIIGKIRVGGATHPAHGLYDKLNEINDYTIQYHHGEDPADATPDAIDPIELKGFAKRTLKIVKGCQG
jgi:wobble nucleotide-excising tRNase